MDPSRQPKFRADLCRTLTDLSIGHGLPTYDASVFGSSDLTAGPVIAGGGGAILGGVRDWQHVDGYVSVGTYAAASGGNQFSPVNARSSVGHRNSAAGFTGNIGPAGLLRPAPRLLTYSSQQQQHHQHQQQLATQQFNRSLPAFRVELNSASDTARLEEFVATVLDGDHSASVLQSVYDHDRQALSNVSHCDPLVSLDPHVQSHTDDYLSIAANPLFADSLDPHHQLLGVAASPQHSGSVTTSPTMEAPLLPNMMMPVAFRTPAPQPTKSTPQDVAARKKIVAKRTKQRPNTSDVSKQPANPAMPSPQKPLKPIDDYTKFVNYVPECLERFGFCVVDKFAGRTFGTAVMNEVCGLYNLGGFEDGLLTSQAFASTEVRGDRVFWLERENSNRLTHICQLLRRLDNLFLRLHGRLGEYHITSRSKAMLACYPAEGRGYRRHVDNPNQDGRVITAIYYLNKNWDPKNDGGVLRMFPALLPENAVDVEPVFDRVVFFWSDHRTPHEVQPAYRPRYAVTIWYFDDAQRQQARIRYTQQGSLEEQHPRLAAVALTTSGVNTAPSSVQ